MPRILMVAFMTGAFCAVFAMLVDFATNQLAIWQIAIAGPTSGFLGSLFAQLVLGRRK